jgi:hypothetical protein
MSDQETQFGNNSVDSHNDPFSSADGMTARRLANISGEPSIDRAREAFDRAARDGKRGSYSRGTYRSLGEGNTRRSVGGSSPVFTLICGIGLGAALMYLIDPAQGERRRSLLRDKLTGAKRQASELPGDAPGDVGHGA